MKSVLISINPQFCKEIIEGRKTLEIRKTRPKIHTPFKCYIYETKGKGLFVNCGQRHERIGGAVIGEFICDYIKCFESEFADDETYERIQEKYEPEDFSEYGEYEYETVAENGEDNYVCWSSCLTWTSLRNYIGQGIREFYGWHISQLKVYDKPRKLSEYRLPCKQYEKGNGCGDNACPLFEEPSYEYGDVWHDCEGRKPITRAPQSWCRVEES